MGPARRPPGRNRLCRQGTTWDLDPPCVLVDTQGGGGEGVSVVHLLSAGPHELSRTETVFRPFHTRRGARPGGSSRRVFGLWPESPGGGEGGGEGGAAEGGPQNNL